MNSTAAADAAFTARREAWFAFAAARRGGQDTTAEESAFVEAHAQRLVTMDAEQAPRA